ncbi:MAG TPA: hypothetical protein VLF93_04965 [Candidatus Saccharimonadales bacterium]|nr:hypothetical protein [Candidatus Saccharimonadales bacterium]
MSVPLFHSQAHADWSVVDSPNYVDHSNPNGDVTDPIQFYNVSAVSNNDIWAVGSTQYGWSNTTAGVSQWQNSTFGTWPSSFDTPNFTANQQYAIYLTY